MTCFFKLSAAFENNQSKIVTKRVLLGILIFGFSLMVLLVLLVLFDDFVGFVGFVGFV